MKWLSIIISIFLVQTAASWAYLFWLILRHDEVLVFENNRVWLLTEFGIATGLMILGSIGLFFTYKSLFLHKETIDAH